jgi:hypothetical protein
MQASIKNYRSAYKYILYSVLALGFITAMAQPFGGKKEKTSTSVTDPSATEKKIPATDPAVNTDKQLEAESKAAFLEAYRVFMHPRCMNCHPSGDAPLQGDDSRIHAQNVTRGPDGKGLYAMKCANCHQAQHVPGQNMPPGHALWHLPPATRKMVFEGKTPKQLAMHFKDNKYTGFKNFKKDMIHHVEEEPLVKNSWTYGTPPPLTHEEFVAKVKEWIAKGAAIPDK